METDLYLDLQTETGDSEKAIASTRINNGNRIVTFNFGYELCEELPEKESLYLPMH